MFSVHRASKRVGFKEVGEEEDWNLYWTDFSVSLERVMEMKRYQVRMADSIYTLLLLCYQIALLDFVMSDFL